MIYSNSQKEIITKEFPFGTLKGILLGEEGRGRTGIFIPVRGIPEDQHGLFEYKPVNGLYRNENIGIGMSKSGRPVIVSASQAVAVSDGIILTSYNGYTRRGNGFVEILEGGEIVAIGVGADGEAGRVGQWQESLIKPLSESIKIHVRYSGGRVSNPISADYFLIKHDGDLYFMRQDELETFEDLKGGNENG